MVSKRKKALKPFRYVPLEKLPFKYLPPNLATASNMVVGFLSIIFAVKGEFRASAWLIILCVFIDGLDGMLARILKARSHFGIEFDSFSDFVSFGIAPPSAVLSYLYSGDFLTGNIASMMWIATVGAIFYALMAAIRLARFNVQTIALGDKIFQGIPTTASAGIIAAFYLTLDKYGNPVNDPSDLIYVAMLTFVGFGLLMISTVPLMKFRKRKNKLVNIFEKGMTIVCFSMAVARKFPDFLLAMGLIQIAIGIRYGIKIEREMKAEKKSLLSTRAQIEEAVKKETGTHSGS